MESLYSLFEKAEQIEEVMSDIYLLLADGASDPGDAQDSFASSTERSSSTRRAFACLRRPT